MVGSISFGDEAVRVFVAGYGAPTAGAG